MRVGGEKEDRIRKKTKFWQTGLLEAGARNFRFEKQEGDDDDDDDDNDADVEFADESEFLPEFFQSPRHILRAESRFAQLQNPHNRTQSPLVLVRPRSSSFIALARAV